MPLAAEAIAALDPARVAAALRAGGGPIGISRRRPRAHASAEDVILTLRAPEGYSVEREGAHAVALDLAIDDELREEGYAREIVHAVQNARKAAGLAVEDRIALSLDGDRALIARGRGASRLPRRRDARGRAHARRSGAAAAATSALLASRRTSTAWS